MPERRWQGAARRFLRVSASAPPREAAGIKASSKGAVVAPGRWGQLPGLARSATSQEVREVAAEGRLFPLCSASSTGREKTLRKRGGGSSRRAGPAASMLRFRATDVKLRAPAVSPCWRSAGGRQNATTRPTLPRVETWPSSMLPAPGSRPKSVRSPSFDNVSHCHGRSLGGMGYSSRTRSSSFLRPVGSGCSPAYPIGNMATGSRASEI